MVRKSSMMIGPRTKQDILKGKVIRKHDDGGDMFEDYWTDSDGESSILCQRSHALSKLPDIESSNFAKAYNFRQSKISLKSSKSISRSTKKDAKIGELQLQHDKYDEKIMQMVHMNDSENEKILQQTSKKRKNRSPMLEENKFTSKSLEKSTNAIPEVNLRKSKKKQRKIENQGEAKKSKLRNTNSDNVNEDPNAVRRSSRQRFTPFDHWRNERLLYRFENGNIKTVGVDNGTKEDCFIVKAIIRKTESKSKPKKKILIPKKAKILDVIENKHKSIHLQKKFPLVPWDKPNSDKNQKPEHEFLIKRMIQTDRNNFGFIQLDVGKIKPAQFIPEEDLQLTLIDGRVEIHIRGEIYILERKDMFVIPRGSAYSIINVGNVKAFLSYAVGNFGFLNKI